MGYGQNIHSKCFNDDLHRDSDFEAIKTAKPQCLTGAFSFSVWGLDRFFAD
jgi:hypothetical protein